MKRTGKLPGRRYQEGAVAIIVGLCIVVLIGFLGLVADLGRLFITKTELSNAADACALAAAAELKGDVESLNRAESAGITVGQRNKVNFQDNAVSIVVNSDVTFSDQLAGTFNSKDVITSPSEIARMKYAKCTLPQTGIVPWFMGVMGQGAQSVTAHAVASLAPSQTNCAIPVGLCEQPFPAGETIKCADPDEYGYCIGQWYKSRSPAGNNGTLNGNFMLIDYSPSGGGGASEVAALLTGAGQCELEIDPESEVGQTGLEGNSVGKAWNTRFGVYQGSSDSPSSAPPDFSGFSYTPTTWPSMQNAYNDFVSAQSGNLLYQGNDVNNPISGAVNTGLSLNGYKINPTLTTDLEAVSANRRMVLMPIVDCESLTGGTHQSAIQNFACVLMLHPMSWSDPVSGKEETYIEYRGRADQPNPCATLGLPGAPGGIGPKVPALVR